MLPPTFDLSSLPFSDRHTIVAPDGQRYRFERIPDQNSTTNTTPLSAVSTDPETVNLAAQQSNHPPPVSTDRNGRGSASSLQQLSDSSEDQTSSLPPRGTETHRPPLVFGPQTSGNQPAFATSNESLQFPSNQCTSSFGNLQTIWEPARGAESSIANRNRHPYTSATQPSHSENAVSNPLIPATALPSNQHNSDFRLAGHINARIIPITGPPAPDGLMPMLSNSGTSGSSASGQFISGEALVFERIVQYSRNYSEFKAEGMKEALLKVYESPLTKDLRFSLITGGTREVEYNFEVPHASGELVLAYAYESSWPDMVYLQKRSGHDTKHLLPPESRKIIWMCRFVSIEDLADFQSQILGEDIVLDISSVRAARVKTKRTEISNPGCRIQIWHERRGPNGMLSDRASYISNDTVLSGPAREKTRPRYDRLLIFFSRLEEYLSILITDDIEIKESGHVSLTIKARKYTGRYIWRSRESIKGYYARRTSHAAGFPLAAPTAAQPGDEDAYESFESIIIEFEDKTVFDHFNDIWTQSLKWRREQRKVLKCIEEEMVGEQFTGKDAKKIWFYSG